MLTVVTGNGGVSFVMKHDPSLETNGRVRSGVEGLEELATCGSAVNSGVLSASEETEMR
jgi:hypothetical protein